MRSSSFIEHFQVSTAAGKVKILAKRLAQLFGSVDDPEDVDSGHAEVDPAEDAALLRLDVVQEEDQRVEEVVAALKKEQGHGDFNSYHGTLASCINWPFQPLSRPMIHSSRSILYIQP